MSFQIVLGGNNGIVHLLPNFQPKQRCKQIMVFRGGFLGVAEGNCHIREALDLLDVVEEVH